MINLNNFRNVTSDQDACILEYFTKNRPHVVLLGAGASCAAIPEGDLHGNKISPMQGFCKAMGACDYLNQFNLKTKSDNLEDIYMEIDEKAKNDSEFQRLKFYLENDIRCYLGSFELPKQPTIYDFLLLGLRDKDIVATFNWDPMLVEAAIRVRRITTNIPELVFLHGNIGVKCKIKNDLITYFLCGSNYIADPDEYFDMPLLYPIKNKNYNKESCITLQWEKLKYYLTKAYRFTIFGYGAPKSDVEAVSLLKDGWGDNEKRNYEQVDIIDIRDPNELRLSWSDFIFSHHFSIVNNFFDSDISKFPRRTCETLFDTKMDLAIEKEGTGFKEGMTFHDIENFLTPLLNNENDPQSRFLNNPYVVPFKDWAGGSNP